jgi:hypothetical protein
MHKHKAQLQTYSLLKISAEKQADLTWVNLNPET